MALTVYTEVKINLTNISSTLRSWKVIEKDSDSSRTCTIETSSNIYTVVSSFRVGMAVTVKRGTTNADDQFVFEGYVDKIDRQGSNILITCTDKLIDLSRATVTYSYNGALFPSTEAKGSDIAKDLIETHGGMTATVVDTGNVLTINKFICNSVDVLSRLTTLAEIYDYQVYYDAGDQTVHFEPKGYTNNSQIIYTGGENKNTSNLPKWVYDKSQMINQLIVKGAVQEVQDEEYFNGTGGASQSFTLAKEPITVQVWEDVAGTWTLKTPGVENSTNTSYDYTIDKEEKTITPTDSWTPGSGSNNIKIVYINAIPVPVQVEDLESQDTYGLHSTTKHYSDIQDVSDAETRGQGILERYKDPFVSTTIQSSTLFDYEAGQSVRIIDSIHNEDRTLIINQIIKQFPFKPDELSLGDKEWKLSDWGAYTIERIRRLEEENQNNTDLLISVKNFNHTVDFERRYCKIVKKTITSDGFILGHKQYGILGTSKLGDPMGNEVLQRVVWPEQKVIETFVDTDFYDSTNSTNTSWSDTGILEFTTVISQAISEIVFKNNETITSIKITPEGIGNYESLEFYACADGDTETWELVTINSTHNFSTTGQELKYKIQNGEGGSGSGWPTAWGTWGSTSGLAASLTKITIEVTT